MNKSVWVLVAATVLLFIAVFLPDIPFPSKKFDYYFVLDITRSMNVQDYQDDNGDPISRLEKAKASAIRAVRQLPCGSRVGLGVFTERMPTTLFTPIEVCQNYQEIRQTIDRVDWRMAWVADSHIIQALSNTLELMRTTNLQHEVLVFFTDGHEAPPVNTRYSPDLGAEQTTEDDNSKVVIKGLIVGTGDTAMSRIPKHDEEGQLIGFYAAEDVPHRSTFGLPEDPSKIEGYHPRNGPWGSTQDIGSEHLSSVKESYLQSMAESAHLHYHRLTEPDALLEAMMQDDFATSHVRPTNLSALPALLALILLILSYLPRLHFRRNPHSTSKTA